MRYVFVSDIHGCYNKLIAELQRVGFDKEKDTLVSVGDPFDRGLENHMVLEFLMNLPHRIIIWGNHDARLNELLSHKDSWNQYDLQNGTDETVLNWAEAKYFGEALRELMTPTKDTIKYRLELWEQYKKEAVWAIEFKDLIAVHAWLPCRTSVDKWGWQIESSSKLNENWRTASYQEWYDTSWGNTETRISAGLFPEKTLLIGHWHAWRLAERFLKETRATKQPYGQQINCDMVQLGDKVIAIDGCSNWPAGGCVNAYVYETDEEPIKYSAKMEETVDI